MSTAAYICLLASNRLNHGLDQYFGFPTRATQSFTILALQFPGLSLYTQQDCFVLQLPGLFPQILYRFSLQWEDPIVASVACRGKWSVCSSERPSTLVLSSDAADESTLPDCDTILAAESCRSRFVAATRFGFPCLIRGGYGFKSDPLLGGPSLQKPDHQNLPASGQKLRILSRCQIWRSPKSLS